MSQYLLDTGVLFAYLLARPRIVSLVEPLILQQHVVTCIMVYGELIEYHQSFPDYLHRKQGLDAIIQQVHPIQPHKAIMVKYAELRRSLRPPHGPGIIGDIDTVIAANALLNNLTLITADRDFSRVSGLKTLHVERSWLKA